jgi:hypothetical protein
VDPCAQVQLEVLTLAGGAARLLGDNNAAVDLLNRAADLWDQVGNAEQAAQTRTMALSSRGDSLDELNSTAIPKVDGENSR